jgi:hypothetical protein
MDQASDRCVVLYDDDSIDLDQSKKMFLMSCLQKKALLSLQTQIFSWWSTKDTVYDLVLIWVAIATGISLDRVFVPDSFIMDMLMYRHFVACTGIIPYWFSEKKYVSSATKLPPFYPKQRQQCQEDQQKILSGTDEIRVSPAMEDLKKRISTAHARLDSYSTGNTDDGGLNSTRLDCLSKPDFNMYYRNNPHYPLLFLVKCNTIKNSITFNPYHPNVDYTTKINPRTSFEQLYKRKTMNINTSMVDYNLPVIRIFPPPSWLIFEEAQINPIYKRISFDEINKKRHRERGDLDLHGAFDRDTPLAEEEEEEEKPKKRAHVYLPDASLQQLQPYSFEGTIQNDVNMDVDHRGPPCNC